MSLKDYTDDQEHEDEEIIELKGKGTREEMKLRERAKNAEGLV